MRLMSDEYLALLQQKHADKPWGGTGHSWVQHISAYLDQFDGPPSVLDYGCGRGTFKRAMEALEPEIRVDEYDPGIPEKSAQPKSHDIVVCTDVMEHIEPEFVDQTIRFLGETTKKVCFMVIACELSKSLLPDGRNTHLTVQPADWWYDKVKRHFGGVFSLRALERKRGRTILEVVR
jgi:hypothetical protein